MIRRMTNKTISLATNARVRRKALSAGLTGLLSLCFGAAIATMILAMFEAHAFKLQDFAQSYA